MMSEAYGPTCCSFGLVPESKLSHHPKDQYGFVPKLSHHGGKKLALRAEKGAANHKYVQGTMMYNVRFN